MVKFIHYIILSLELFRGHPQYHSPVSRTQVLNQFDGKDVVQNSSKVSGGTSLSSVFLNFFEVIFVLSVTHVLPSLRMGYLQCLQRFIKDVDEETPGCLCLQSWWCMFSKLFFSWVGYWSVRPPSGRCVWDLWTGPPNSSWDPIHPVDWLGPVDKTRSTT